MTRDVVVDGVRYVPAPKTGQACAWLSCLITDAHPYLAHSHCMQCNAAIPRDTRWCPTHTDRTHAFAPWTGSTESLPEGITPGVRNLRRSRTVSHHLAWESTATNRICEMSAPSGIAFISSTGVD